MTPAAAAPRAPERKSDRAPEGKGRTAAASGRAGAATKTRSAKASAAPSRAQRNQRAIANARAAERAGAAPATRTAPARRKSGAAPAPRKSPATRPSSPVARVLNSRGMPLVDRVLRGPAWVVMLGVLLAGIVFLNVSVLELNRGIARTDAKAGALERTNSGLRERVAKLDSGERIQELAAARGFVMPQPGEVTFVRPRGSDARLAASRITAPNGSATATTVPTTQTGYTTGSEPGVGTTGAVGTTSSTPGAGTTTTEPTGATTVTPTAPATAPTVAAPTQTAPTPAAPATAPTATTTQVP
jgi:cell division protein FtsL